MPNPMTPNPIVMIKFVLWLLVLAITTILLNRKKLSSKLRLVFLAGGTLLFGFVFGFLIPGDLNPNPPASLRTLLASLLVKHQIIPLVAGMLVILLVTVWISNKSICGWGCQLGLLQDLLYRAPLPKFKLPFRITNSVRLIALAALVAGLVAAGVDWIGVIDPFKLFTLDIPMASGIFLATILVASLFLYRPWCQLFCPFGMVGWLVEQVSIYRPRVNRESCKSCMQCVKACPTHAMKGILAGNRFRADCFACGACIEACPRKDTLGWWAPAQVGKKSTTDLQG
ncbi:MAG: 4Fe-4S binding protein [Anaerolineales bacterium]|nr:4Fe-4S binding protein [Anaerolineales bacterium]